MLAYFVWAYFVCLAKASLSKLEMNRWRFAMYVTWEIGHLGNDASASGIQKMDA